MVKSRDLQTGFTLVEVAMVIIIGGIMMMTATAAMLNYMKQARTSTAQNRMKIIDTAISQFLDLNGYLPCPARLNDAPDSATFGVAIANDCTTAPVVNPETFQAAGRGGRLVRIGAVPTRTLNLPDEYMSDSWGDRFTYAVTEVLAAPTSLVPPLHSYDPTLGSISVVDSTNNDIAVPAGSAHYVIVSAGNNRIGAYTTAGKLGLPCIPAALEGLNCGHTDRFRKTLMAGTTTGAAQFDDIVTFRTVPGTGTIPTGMIAIIPSLPAPACPPMCCPPKWTLYSNAAPNPVLPALPGNLVYCVKQ